MSKIVTFNKFNCTLEDDKIREIVLLIKKARRQAIKALDHFYDILDLDKDIIDVIKEEKIDIVFYAGDKYAARHISTRNCIKMNAQIIVKLLELNSNGKMSYEEIFNILIHCLIHEYLHSIRDMCCLQNFSSSTKEAELYEKLSSKYSHLINESKQVLSIEEREDSFIFTMFNETSFKIKEIKKSIIKNKFNIEHVNFSDDLVKIVRCQGKSKLITNPYWYMISNAVVGDDEFIGLEEALVDSLALLVLKHKDSPCYDERILEKLIINNTYNYYGLGFYIIQKMSIDDIKWFFTSYMQDIFENRIEKILGANYKSIRNILNYLYKNCTEEEIVKQERYQNKREKYKRLVARS